MISIQSQRLLLLALPLAEFELFLDNQPLLAEQLGLIPDVIQLDKGFWEEGVQDMRSYSLPKIAENPDRYEWFTVWLIVMEAENRMVGGIGGGMPNEEGDVHFGYFVDKRYERRGIATEAAKALIQWIFQNSDAKSIVADTLVDGFASQKVLQKCGFSLEKTTEEGNLRWRLTR